MAYSEQERYKGRIILSPRVFSTLVSWQRTSRHQRMPSNDGFKQPFLILQELSKKGPCDPEKKKF